MKLIIDVSNTPEVRLEKDGEIIALRQWVDNFDLDTHLLEEIDKLLKENKIELKDLEKAEAIIGEQRFTTGRIAQAVAEGINATLNSKFKNQSAK